MRIEIDVDECSVPDGYMIKEYRKVRTGEWFLNGRGRHAIQWKERHRSRSSYLVVQPVHTPPDWLSKNRWLIKCKGEYWVCCVQPVWDECENEWKRGDGGDGPQWWCSVIYPELMDLPVPFAFSGCHDRDCVVKGR